MAILMGDLRMALLTPGAPEDLAIKAAPEVATYEARLVGVETRLSVLTWMVGAVIALCATIQFRVFH